MQRPSNFDDVTKLMHLDALAYQKEFQEKLEYIYHIKLMRFFENFQDFHDSNGNICDFDSGIRLSFMVTGVREKQYYLRSIAFMHKEKDYQSYQGPLPNDIKYFKYHEDIIKFMGQPNAISNFANGICRRLVYRYEENGNRITYSFAFEETGDLTCIILTFTTL